MRTDTCSYYPWENVKMEQHWFVAAENSWQQTAGQNRSSSLFLKPNITWNVLTQSLIHYALDHSDWEQSANGRLLWTGQWNLKFYKSRNIWLAANVNILRDICLYTQIRGAKYINEKFIVLSRSRN
jgi:hypothetical protein